MDQNYYGITQASQLTGYPQHVIRYYEKEFNLKIPRNKSNHRYFTQAEIDILKYIKSLQEKGFSNTQIKLILHSPDIANQLLNDMSDVAVTCMPQMVENYMYGYNGSFPDEMLTQVKQEFYAILEKQLNLSCEPIKVAIYELIEKVNNFIDYIDYKNTGKEILYENIKLKKELKRKNCQIAKLMIKIEKSRNQNI